MKSSCPQNSLVNTLQIMSSLVESLAHYTREKRRKCKLILLQYPTASEFLILDYPTIEVVAETNKVTF